MTNCQKKCFISLVAEALEMKKKFKLYTSEKENSRAGNENAAVNNCSCTPFSEYDKNLSGSPGERHPSPRKAKKCLHFKRMFLEDSRESVILKSVFGFLGGIILTYIFFMFLVFSLNFTLRRATCICAGLGVVLSLGLAFSVKIRCTVFLCLPQLFTKRGRQALLAYAFILALSGPAKNTLHNVEVMSESLACGQEQLKQAENELLKCVQKPNAAAKKSIDKLVEKINCAVKDFKHFILQLYRNCYDILETVLHAHKWLYSISLLCRRKMGKPTKHCVNLLTESVENCESMSKLFSWKKTCHVRSPVKRIICESDAADICQKSDIAQTVSTAALQKKLRTFKRRAMNIFNMRVEARQMYSQCNRSYTYHEEYQGMATEIRQKTDQFLQYFDFMSVIFGIFILVLFVKVIIYRHKFLTEDHYDNKYITSDFEDIDNTRAEFQMQTLLPLGPKEKLKYIKVTCPRLLPSEKVRLVSSFIFLIFATFKIIVHMLTDSSLYWILSTVRRNQRLLYKSNVREEESSITVRVTGEGLVAALFRNVTRAVRRQTTTSRMDPTPCLPDPVPPDWNRYYQILALVIICWLLAVCEPYGLRLRHTVMITYHPDRARERAIWLYNKIISDRTTFVKVSRRALRRRYKDGPPKSIFRFPFGKKRAERCLMCEVKLTTRDDAVRCSSVKCLGVYCVSCYGSQKCCILCTDPADYGDLSDQSEEKDSSEEEVRGPAKCGSPTPRQTCRSQQPSTCPGVKQSNFGDLTESPGAQPPVPQLRLSWERLAERRRRKKKKAISDLESSDWTSDEEGTSPGRSTWSRSREGSKRRKCGRKRKREERSSRQESPRDFQENPPAVRIFQKLSDLWPCGKPAKPLMEGNVAVRRDRPSRGHSDDERPGKKKPVSPEFLFRTAERAPRVPTLLATQDSIERLRVDLDRPPVRKKSIRFADSDRNSESDERKAPPKEGRSASPPAGGTSSRATKMFPFVDPANLHTFTSWLSIPEGPGGRRSGSPSSRTPRSSLKSPTTVRFKEYEEASADRGPGGSGRRRRESTSPESDGGQYFSEPYVTSAERLSDAGSELRRATARLNLDSSSRTCAYSIETDSSDEDFLSARPARTPAEKNPSRKPPSPRGKTVRFADSTEESCCDDVERLEYYPGPSYFRH